VAEKPHNAIVKFDTYRNLQQNRAVLPAIARHLVILCIAVVDGCCCCIVLVARSASRMQETRFQLYLAQQHIEEINFNRFAVLIETIPRHIGC